jgi:RNA polymerase-binding transcription factor DksA
VRLRNLRDRLGSGVAELRSEALRPVGAEATNGTARGTVHDADLGARTADEELALELLAPEAEVLAEVDAALERVRLGTFGVCEACGHPISQARLSALGYARRCIRCARSAV